MNPSAASPFVALRPVHRLADRVRFRFDLAQGTLLEPPGITRAVENLPGVRTVRLAWRARSLTITFAPDETDVERLTAALRDLHLPPHLPQTPAHPVHGKAWMPVAASAALLLSTKQLSPPLQRATTLTAALPLYGEALGDVFKEGINSHVLEALAVAISTASQDYVAANTTVFMLALGEYLENSIARRSNDLLKNLLRPDTGWVWVEQDGVERQIEASEVTVGATVIVGAGAAIPVDGTVLGGEAMVNEASMTGEAVPVSRRRGDVVLSGTVVEEGRLRIYAEHVGRKTAAARIADYVEQSLQAKSQTQLGAARLADKLVPGVLGLAGVTWWLTGDWRRAAAVLQADYACALKLATPVAFKSAMFRAGQSGILIKGADVLERLAEVDTFVFDKTGTLTTGHLAVTDSIAFDPQYSAEDLIDLAASVEEHYFHPLALAVVQAARQNQGRHFDHKEVEFIAAHGVATVIEGQRVVVGSRHFVEDDEGVRINTRQRQRIERLFAQGKTLLYIGFGGRLLGVIALKDQLREASAATVARLRSLGVKRIVMLTGDHPDRAAEIAAQIGLDEFHAQLLPEDKAALVAQMKADGAKLAFVGDGINDAPALAGAHVGFAMAQGADIARLSSDIALLEDDIARVADAKQLANATLRLIGRNFKLTVGLNSAILAAAAAGKLTPVAASVAHNGSTIGILLNALRGGQAALPRRRAQLSPR
ncbi:heavy metal translocating P-type ATPase [Rhodoferax fermentans]|uniref:P-type Zn(2+) transporter n=1 Tax=Rhodoferax fermentans TaxID=28066 RepID=A0A1T1ATQ7_RHOFE|nr:heavy metal translocating P-type ATPase [Rhodoferax fermentans]MBK1685118.1 heavy metal translocating P-type ATPase [Rhodoferax fermentans]OOV07338.1 ATPase [Rhodoferax fermentans]